MTKLVSIISLTTTTCKILSRAVLPKVGCCGSLNHTKSGIIVLTKCIYVQHQGKEHKSSMKVLKQSLGSSDLEAVMLTVRIKDN